MKLLQKLQYIIIIETNYIQHILYFFYNVFSKILEKSRCYGSENIDFIKQMEKHYTRIIYKSHITQQKSSAL